MDKININNKLSQIIYYIILALIISFGLFLRLKQYFAGYPFWEDEILLHENIIHYPFLHSFQLLDYYQIAPPLYQCLIKLINTFFGINIYSTRFINLMCSCVSFIMFCFLLNSTFKNKLTILTALLLFAINGPLIYYSAELKPYISDSFILILLFLIYNKINLKTFKDIVFWAVIFFILPFYSFTSLFVLGAIILSKIIDIFTSDEYDFNAKKKEFFKYVLISLIILSATLILYKINTDYTANMKEDWSFGFLSLSFHSFVEVTQNFLQYLGYNENITLIFFILGILFALFSKNKILRLALITFLLQIFSSLIHTYPFIVRLSTFIIPVFILFIASLVELCENTIKNKYPVIKSLPLVLILLYSINLIPNIKDVSDKNYTIISQPIEIRRNKTDEVLNFLDLYKDGDKYICKYDFSILTRYYNNALKYNHKLDLVDIFYDEKNIERIEKNLNENPNNNFWIFGIVNSSDIGADNLLTSDDDMQKVFDITNRRVKIYPTKNGNIYFLEKINYQG